MVIYFDGVILTLDILTGDILTAGYSEAMYIHGTRRKYLPSDSGRGRIEG